MDLLPRYPHGWYALAFSSDLAPGELLNQHFMGQEVVLFRTASGEVCLMDAYCPHLGAHMGRGGRVNGECIQCPFHHFEFNVQGVCTTIPYGTRIPPKAQARVFPTVEQHGLILGYFERDGSSPDWSVPALDTRGWLPLRSQQWSFRGHPQETTENSVDLGHFTEVHGYQNITIVQEVSTAGPYLTNRYTITRPKAFLGRAVTIDLTLHVHGLGYSLVEVHVQEFDIRSRLFVLATPTREEQLQLRIAVSMHGAADPAQIHPLLRLVPRRLVNRILAAEILKGFAHDVMQDIPIWNHKRYVQPPILAAGDGPIGVYRQWAKQFYPPEARRRI
jgi:phenylpropionate dioxygenase-like ring-hydroxylating dioxygenase large terminal subunit